MCTDDGTGPERQCSIVGPPDGVQRAAQIVRELVQNAAVRVLCQ